MVSLLLSLFGFRLLMILKKIRDDLLVDLEKGDFDFAILVQVLALRKLLEYLVKDALDYSLVSTFDHHVVSYLANRGLFGLILRTVIRLRTGPPAYVETV
jgi:hypothetical protein